MKDERIYDSIWQYLDETGVLENGTEEEIKQAKKDYWRIYQRQYKRRMRKAKRQVVVWFTKQELKALEEARRGNKNSLPQFVKDTTLAYSKQQFLVPDPYQIGRIEQHLSLIRQSIHELSNRDSDNWFSDTRRYRRIEKMLVHLQAALVDRLRNPELLESYIQWAKENDPELLSHIKQILNHDH